MQSAFILEHYSEGVLYRVSTFGAACARHRDSTIDGRFRISTVGREVGTLEGSKYACIGFPREDKGMLGCCVVIHFPEL